MQASWGQGGSGQFCILEVIHELRQGTHCDWDCDNALILHRFGGALAGDACTCMCLRLRTTNSSASRGDPVRAVYNSQTCLRDVLTRRAVMHEGF